MLLGFVALSWRFCCCSRFLAAAGSAHLQFPDENEQYVSSSGEFDPDDEQQQQQQQEEEEHQEEERAHQPNDALANPDEDEDGEDDEQQQQQQQRMLRKRPKRPSKSAPPEKRTSSKRKRAQESFELFQLGRWCNHRSYLYHQLYHYKYRLCKSIWDHLNVLAAAEFVQVPASEGESDQRKRKVKFTELAVPQIVEYILDDKEFLDEVLVQRCLSLPPSFSTHRACFGRNSGSFARCCPRQTTLRQAA